MSENIEEIDKSPERVQEKAKCVHIKALAIIHSQQCMAHHGTGPEVQAAWIEFCKCVDVYEERK